MKKENKKKWHTEKINPDKEAIRAKSTIGTKIKTNKKTSDTAKKNKTTAKKNKTTAKKNKTTAKKNKTTAKKKRSK